MSFCHALLTSFVGRGLAPAAILFGQSGTTAPTVRKQAFINSLTKKRCGRDALIKQSGGLFVAKAGSNL